MPPGSTHIDLDQAWLELYGNACQDGDRCGLVQLVDAGHEVSGSVLECGFVLQPGHHALFEGRQQAGGVALLCSRQPPHQAALDGGHVAEQVVDAALDDKRGLHHVGQAEQLLHRCTAGWIR